MKTAMIDDMLYPPFEGFPMEGIQFLKKLRRNNKRTWFASHKTEYEEFVKFQMETLIASLAPVMHDYAPDYEVNPKRSMFRIYRDTRFSKDKTPYKTHVAASFTPKGRGHDEAGFYLHIEPGEIYLGGGIYGPDSDQLRSIRLAIANQSDAFLGIVNDPAFRKMYGTIEGESLTRVPQGFERDHPLKEYLRLKQFYAGVALDEKVCTTKKFLSIIHTHFRTITPFIDFLQDAMRGGRR